MKNGKLIIISAPSGAGKTSICKRLLESNSKWLFSVSATTRNKRDYEVDGKDYIFMKKEKFDHAEKFGEFIESEWVHGHKYGTLYKPIEDVLDNGHVHLVDKMGSDLTVCNAARVSFNNESEWAVDEEVEARLKALETKVEELVVKAHGHAPTTGTTGVQEQLDDLIQRLGRKMKF